MPCDGKNPNCDRRRELLAQLKCLISSMDRKKPCEWDEPSCSPIVCCPAEPPCIPPVCVPIKPCKSFDFRSSIMYRCECIKRNGLQDRCMMWDCMGRPECMTKLYPVCEPGRAALLKLTDLGDVEVALRKFYCADQARESALAAYCRLVSDNTCRKQTLPCIDKRQNVLYIPSKCPLSDCSDRDSWCKSVPCSDSSSYQVYIPSPAYPTCSIPQSLCCPPRKLDQFCPPCEPPPMCLPICAPPVCLPCVQYCPVT